MNTLNLLKKPLLQLKRSTFLICYCFFTFCWAGNTNYPYRTGNNPPIKLKENDRIVLITPPRTGSTLIYNVLVYLFEDLSFNVSINSSREKRVIKTHSLDKIDPFSQKLAPFNIYFVSTIRNPIDTHLSLSRVNMTKANPKEKKTVQVLDKAFRKIQNLHEKYGNKHLVLKYEDFDNNFGYIFEKIEEHFCISLDEEVKNQIVNNFSKTQLKNKAKLFTSFNEYDNITGIHGDHIRENEYQISKELYRSLKEKYLLHLKYWGYE